MCDLSYFACERFRASIFSISSMSVSFHIGIYLFRFDSFPVWPDYISYSVMACLRTAYAVLGLTITSYLVYGLQAGQGNVYAVRHPHSKQSLSFIGFLMLLRCKIFQWICGMRQSTKNWTSNLYFLHRLLHSRICFPVLFGCQISQ